MLAKTLIAAAALIASALAVQTATVVLESSNGGSGLTNTTVSVEINDTYDDENKLAGVSTLYLTGANGIPVDSITCTPFSNPDGTGKIGPVFDSTTPSVLSTGAKIGSIVCITTAISQSPLAPPGMSSLSSSTTLVTATAGPHHHQSTVTGPKGASATPQSSSTSTAASQNAGNSASSLNLSGECFALAAFVAFGVAFAL